ncbi:MAG: uncharacterized protein JWO38_2208 [Gemmataceae bacterium]|nr:uncharacterized protein [Gemmataceae bacterium]
MQLNELLVPSLGDLDGAAALGVPPSGSGPAISPQGANGGCGCGRANGADAGGAQRVAASYVYALGRVGPRFPSPGVEKEFAQATGRAGTDGLSDRQALHAVLSKRENRYLARQLCWVLAIEGVETYLLYPRDPGDFHLLVESVRPVPRPTDVDVVIGMRGAPAPPEVCNGLMLPVVGFDQMYSFGVDALLQSIPRPEGIDAGKFGPATEEVFSRYLQMADNAGATDEHRALNYLAVRYPAIYATAAEAYGRNASLTAVDARPSPLSGARKILDVVFSFTHRTTDVTEKHFVRVDVTEEFPFLVTKLSPYIDR